MLWPARESSYGSCTFPIVFNPCRPGRRRRARRSRGQPSGQWWSRGYEAGVGSAPSCDRIGRGRFAAKRRSGGEIWQSQIHRDRARRQGAPQTVDRGRARKFHGRRPRSSRGNCTIRRFEARFRIARRRHRPATSFPGAVGQRHPRGNERDPTLCWFGRLYRAVRRWALGLLWNGLRRRPESTNSPDCRSHVLDKIVKRVARNGSISGGVYKLGDNIRIDFDGEADAHGKRLLKVEAGIQIGIGADAALLAVRSPEDIEHANAEVPAHLDRRMEIPASGKPIAGSVCLIGFPARFEPPRSQPNGHRTDWEWVRFQLTGATQGVKRLAPGFPSRRPDKTTTEAGRRFGHDATTAGGNSGSPVIAWKDQDQPAIGVHVSGATFVSNEAELLASMKANYERATTILKERG